MPLPVRELLSARSFAPLLPISLSRDGEWVAYTVADNTRVPAQIDEKYSVYAPITGTFVRGVGGDIYITNLRTGESRNLTGSRGSSWSPQWSPNGRYLAFFSDRGGVARLWVWERASAKLRLVSNAIVRTLAETFVWSPDSRIVVVKVLPKGLTIEEAANLTAAGQVQPPETKVSVSSITVYRSPLPEKSGSSAKDVTITKEGPWSLNRWLGDLALINIQTGNTRRITGITPAEYWLSPDGSHLAFSNLKGFVPNSQEMLSDLVLTSIASDDRRVLVSNVALPFGSLVSWSPDGKRLAYRTSGLLSKPQCFLFSITNGKSQNLTADLKPRLSEQYPLWDVAGRNVLLVGDNVLFKSSVEQGTTTLLANIPARDIVTVVSGPTPGQFWSPDGGRSVVVSTRDKETKKVGFYVIDLSTGASNCLLEEDKDYGSFRYQIAVSRDRRSIVYLAQDSQHPPDLWIYTVGAANSRRITSVSPQLERYKMGTSRLVEWTGNHGKKLSGALLLPPNYDPKRRYPLIVKVYPDASGSDLVNQFGFAQSDVDNLQLLSTRGYAVLFPDIPVNGHYPMKDVSDAVLPAVDKLVELGIADPERLGVMGHSYGGYGTMALIVQTTRFKAAVESAGFANWIGIFGEMNREGSAYGIPHAKRLGGPPWAWRDRYIENSPIFYLDKTQTPLLILHGGADTAVARFLADEIFVGLRSLGKEVTYAVYEGESHWQGTWGFDNKLDFAQRVIDWFDTHLRPAGHEKSANQDR